MKKRFTAERIVFDPERRKFKGHFELFASPSELAREIFHHLMAIGTSRCPQGFDKVMGAERYGYTLHYVRAGEFLHTIDNRTFAVRNGGVCLLDAGRQRRLQNKGRKTVQLWWFMFDGAAMPRLFAELRATGKPVFEGIARRWFESRFHQLWRLIAERPPACEAKVHAVLSDVLAELHARRLREMDHLALSESSPAHSEKVRLALDFTARMYAKDIGLKHFAESLHMNIHHFCRKFRQEVGMAPIHYLYRFRVNQAQRLLVHTDRSIREIAGLVGIPDPGLFARAFHKHTGASPHAYRKKEQAKHNRSSATPAPAPS